MRTVWWEEGTVRLLDQTRLPGEVTVRTCRTWEEVAEAIRTLAIRGAPAIGAAAAYAVVLAVQDAPAQAAPVALQRAVEGLAATRPTAVNLRWALERMQAAASRGNGPLAEVLLGEAEAIAAQDIRANRAIAEAGAALIRPGERILTYCNTGSLATVEGGTAYGILRRAHEQGKGIEVIVCETRPVLQGARLTTWELQRDGIPATLITDNAAGSLMARGEIDRVVVGADRVARNGDVANKIGTYTLAVLARTHQIPFLVAAPLSSVDPLVDDGAAIPLEERPAQEIVRWCGRQVAAEGVRVRNPAFDLTPHHLITAIVTDGGVATPPYTHSLARLLAAVEG
ncbi:MAG: S-methyl-5-thioribose-1-phosphate isomerase [Armatimonadota bacterium]|nr:S-methyl-5-thioribose-1-phosphate isomerase [Armatimonadota bacterium]MDR7428350.1 S-methyl-5-thioribose-1-phosphate isomerase [Armatimonadota bacterium]MDR7464913.1 S-methyl-5-thioribose-1-phosphate isomerase [Armatimonadota bacterium]MDR7470325.1 S-methyl-5-thioribose-1-phosphate isomerase [Armatimonadota bacterium]MDR7475283.1 S-methyl-5-thioribose-1-phosphate isomerase [Armatimonadota bacterium]